MRCHLLDSNRLKYIINTNYKHEIFKSITFVSNVNSPVDILWREKPRKRA